ncbi:hypothetical protein AUK04_02335 [Candidatus Roizmanbacteria bacterium CG2_30_33_16]|uniref:Glycosyl transferase family 1 domain-containing protein n=2 Tax=Candidatus Roizmaniibacteriota TaxID=1752723 RepID=A0A1J5HJ70_9BACT|nr:MAG: hypothetical protein AUK04_02335 [Candidatus Roizmanbacteria bacterium CG2_30_33_16]
MKRKIVALYSPYLDVLGGGEKHILSILQVLEKEEYEINIFWDTNLQKKIEEQFSLQFSNKINWLPNTFKDSGQARMTFILNRANNLKQFDMFFYVTDGSYFLSTAKKNFIFCMVPQKSLYQMNFINRLKTKNCNFICNSKYTQSWLTKWGIKNQVIYPYISNDFINLDINKLKLKKENIILSVGRFFGHLHSKKQSEIIKAFNKLKQDNSLYKDFELILAGGLREEDKTYFESLKKLILDHSDIILAPNLSFTKLLDLYKKAKYFWHFAGYGVDENATPELVEHLGITPLEAMSSGCLTYCYNAGGSKEIIQDYKNGFLFDNADNLLRKMVAYNQAKDIVQYAHSYVKDNFGFKIFEKRVKEII